MHCCNVHMSTSVIYPEHEMELDVFNTLICFVNDFYPPEVRITWTSNGQLVNQSEISQTPYHSNGDFSFRISSYLDFIPREGDIYSCSVEHSSLKAALSRIWGRSPHDESAGEREEQRGAALKYTQDMLKMESMYEIFTPKYV